MTKSLEELKQIEEAARDEWHRASQQHSKMVREAIEEATARIRRFFTADSKRVSELSTALSRAKHERELAEVEAAKNATYALGNGVTLRAGDRVYMMVKGSWKHSYKEKAVRGVIEICTHETNFPANISNGLPSVGSLFVRLIKDDGTPGKQFEILRKHTEWKKEPVAA